VRSALPHDPLEVTTWATAEGALAFLLRRDDEAEPLCRGRIDMARSATIA
jgi:hypothetical protein